MRFIFLLAERRRVRHRTSRIANVIARVGTVWIVFEGIFSLLERNSVLSNGESPSYSLSPRIG